MRDQYEMVERKAEVFLDGRLEFFRAAKTLPRQLTEFWRREVRAWILRRFRPRRGTHVEVWVDGDPELDYIV